LKEPCTFSGWVLTKKPGLWAIAWGDDNPLKCLYIGAALPSIVSFFARQ